VVRLVFDTFEPPTREEGFEEVVKIENTDRAVGRSSADHGR
jgi:hypothetical protein